MSDLPFLQATLKETLRFRPPGPLSIPHVTTEDVQVASYIIPKGTITHHNIWAANYNEQDWKEPYEYRPERFLGDEKENLMLVFGTGIRECIGMNFGKQLLNMVLPQIFSKFKFRSNKMIELMPIFGLTYNPRPQKITVELR